MSRWIAWAFLALVLCGMAWGAVTDWSSVSGTRPYYFQADRGIVTIYVADTAGTVYPVVGRRKWMTSANATIYAYPSYYTGADTAGQGIAAHYLGGSRYLWYIDRPDSTIPYSFYETSGADSAIAELQGIIVQGTVNPAGNVPSKFGPGGSGELEIQGYLLATAVQTGAITPFTYSDDPATTPSAVLGWLPIIQPDARGDSMKVGPATGTQSARLMIEDRSANPTAQWFTIYPNNQDSSWTWTPPPNAGVSGTVLTTDGTGASSWENPIPSALSASTLTLTGAANIAGNVGIGTNAAAALLRLRDGSSNHIDLKAPSIASNFVVSMPATYALGSKLYVSAVSDSNITLAATKDIWTSITTASTTKKIFNVYAPGVTSSYIVVVSYNMGAGATPATPRLNGYAVTDSLGVSCSASPGTGVKFAVHASLATP